MAALAPRRCATCRTRQAIRAFEDANGATWRLGALAYDTTPLGSIGRLDTFSPEFQALVTDKGGMIFHMLRWGDRRCGFSTKTVREFMGRVSGGKAGARQRSSGHRREELQ